MCTDKYWLTVSRISSCCSPNWFDALQIYMWVRVNLLIRIYSCTNLPIVQHHVHQHFVWKGLSVMVLRVAMTVPDIMHPNLKYGTTWKTITKEKHIAASLHRVCVRAYVYPGNGLPCMLQGRWTSFELSTFSSITDFWLVCGATFDENSICKGGRKTNRVLTYLSAQMNGVAMAIELR